MGQPRGRPPVRPRVRRPARSLRRTLHRLGATVAAAAAVVLLGRDHAPAPLEFAGMIEGARPAHPWMLVLGKSWQIQSAESEDPVVSDEAEGTRGACGPGMVEVRGSMRIDSPRGRIEWLQDATCTRWINRDFPERCATFDRDRWLAVSQDLPTARMHFCVDRFEHPNRKGAYPVIAVTWYEAKATCESNGKRLCTEDEWTFACEGEEARPYPTGYTRDSEACVIDRPWRLFDEHRLAVRDSPLAVAEIDSAWQGETCGARPACRSPFGVYDMTGNVDEWTSSVEREGFRSVFKGGYWGPVRARCRAATRAHDEQFYFYQQGFRCCAEAPHEKDAAAPRENGD